MADPEGAALGIVFTLFLTPRSGCFVASAPSSRVLQHMVLDRLLRCRKRVADEAVLVPVGIDALYRAGFVQPRDLFRGQVPADCA